MTTSSALATAPTQADVNAAINSLTDACALFSSAEAHFDALDYECSDQEYAAAIGTYGDAVLVRTRAEWNYLNVAAAFEANR